MLDGSERNAFRRGNGRYVQMPKEDSLALAKQGSIAFVGNIIQKATGFLFLAVVTRFVSPSTFGIFSLALTIVLFLQGLASMNLHRAVDYFVPQFTKEGEYWKVRAVLVQVIAASLVGTGLTAATVVLTASELASTFGEPRLAWALSVLALTLPLLALHDIIGSLFKGLKQVNWMVYMQRIVRPVAKVLATVGLMSMGLQLDALLGGYLAALATALLVGAVLFARSGVGLRGGHGSVDPRVIVSYTAPLVLAGVIYTTVWQIDYFVLGFFGTSEQVGLYRVAFQLTSSLVIILGSFTPIYKPLVARTRDQSTELRSLFQLTTRWGVLFTLPLALPLALVPEAYLSILFTPAYAGIGTTVTVLAIGYFVNALGGPEGMMLEGLGNTRLSLFNALLLIVVNATLDVLLVPRLGVLGAAAGTATALTIRVLAGVLEIHYLHGIHPYTRKFAQMLTAGVPAAVVGGAVAAVLSRPVLAFVAVPIAVTVPYAVALWVLNPFTEEDKLVADRIDKRLGYPIFTHLLP